MKLSDFKTLWDDYEIYDNLFFEKDVPILFNYAMMTNIDEINSDRHMFMQFIEFQEAFCRVAEKFSPLMAHDDPREWSVSERIY